MSIFINQRTIAVSQAIQITRKRHVFFPGLLNSARPFSTALASRRNPNFLVPPELLDRFRSPDSFDIDLRISLRGITWKDCTMPLTFALVVDVVAELFADAAAVGSLETWLAVVFAREGSGLVVVAFVVVVEIFVVLGVDLERVGLCLYSTRTFLAVMSEKESRVRQSSSGARQIRCGTVR